LTIFNKNFWQKQMTGKKMGKYQANGLQTFSFERNV